MRLEHLTKADEEKWRVEFAQQKWTFGALTLTDAQGSMHFGYYLQPLHLNADDREDLPRKVLHVLARQKPPLDFLELSGAGMRIPHAFPKGFTLEKVLRITLQEIKRIPLRDPTLE
ncbi:MAG TPA: hypothetical protein VGA33_00505 [Thermoanaerobaculia bacterium]